MNPGVELDALVAEKVMGGAPGEYSTDIADAWRVIGKLCEASVYREFALHAPGVKDTFGPTWVVSCWSDQLAEEVGRRYVAGLSNVRAEGLTAEHAICLAALKAVGVPVKWNWDG